MMLSHLWSFERGILPMSFDVPAIHPKPWKSPQAALNPLNTFGSVKRWFGRTYAEVRACREWGRVDEDGNGHILSLSMLYQKACRFMIHCEGAWFWNRWIQSISCMTIFNTQTLSPVFFQYRALNEPQGWAGSCVCSLSPGWQRWEGAHGDTVGNTRAVCMCKTKTWRWWVGRSWICLSQIGRYCQYPIDFNMIISSFISGCIAVVLT